MTNDNHAGLVVKINEAIKMVGALFPEGHNREQNYDYFTADQIAAKASEILPKVGITIFPSITDSEWKLTQKGDNAKPFFASTVTFNMIVTDGDTVLELPWTGEGVDYISPDKATYKGITTGRKYFLLSLLHVSVGNPDGEHENEPGDDTQKGTVTMTLPAEPVNPIVIVQDWAQTNLVDKLGITIQSIKAFIDLQGGFQAFVNNDPAAAIKRLQAKFVPQKIEEGAL
jgi:hypothetical protein